VQVVRHPVTSRHSPCCAEKCVVVGMWSANTAGVFAAVGKFPPCAEGINCDDKRGRPAKRLAAPLHSRWAGVRSCSISSQDERNISQATRQCHLCSRHVRRPQWSRSCCQGVVILEATVNEEGAVMDVRLLRAVHPLLDREAERVLRQWRYSPVVLNDIPVPFILTVTLSFSLVAPK